MSSQKWNYQSYSNNNVRYLLAPSYIYGENPQTWSTQFMDSKAQCIQHLNKIKQKIKQQEEAITKYIKKYQQSMIRQFDQQYKQLRAEIIKQLNRTYEQNKLRVKSGFDRENINGKNQAVKDFRGLYLKIDELLRELETGSTYKKGIAKTVLQDFENNRRTMVNKVNQLQKIYQSNSFLKVESVAFNRIKQDIRSLFSYSKNFSLGYESQGFREPSNKQQFNSFSNQRYNIQLSAPQQQFHNLSSPVSNLRPSSFPLNPQLKKQPFSFQPSRVQQNKINQNKRLQSSPSNINQNLKQSSAQQFRNVFSQHFRQYIPNTQFVSSQVYPLSQSQPAVIKVNRHRNRDILKKTLINK